jgi:hypothetical protein
MRQSRRATTPPRQSSHSNGEVQGLLGAQGPPPGDELSGIMDVIVDLDDVDDAVMLCEEAGLAVSPGEDLETLRQMLTAHYQQRGRMPSAAMGASMQQRQSMRQSQRQSQRQPMRQSRRTNGSASPPRTTTSSASSRSSPGRKPPRLPRSPVRTRVRSSVNEEQQQLYLAAGGSTAAGAQELDVEAVKAFLRTEGLEVDDDYAQRCFQCFDLDGSGGISLHEFADLVEQLMPDKLKAPKDRSKDNWIQRRRQRRASGYYQDKGRKKNVRAWILFGVRAYHRAVPLVCFNGALDAHVCHALAYYVLFILS